MMAGKKEIKLVPTEEQPYEIPENWCWVYGGTIFGKMLSKKPTGETFRYIDIDSIDNKNQRVTEPKVTNTEEAPSRASRHLQYGDTVFSLVRPYLKNIAFIDETLSDCIGSTGFYVCRPHKAINPLYIYRLMTSPYVVNGLNAFMKGDNSPSIRGENIEDFTYPLPPLAEQQRIVDTIVDLFADLDKAAENAERIVEDYENRKSAILHQAFTGELTTRWREENGLGMDSWKNHQFAELCNIVRGGSPRPAGNPLYYDGDIPFMKVADITGNNSPYVSSTEHTIKEAGLKKTRMVPPNTLLLTNSGATLGVPAICTIQTTFNDGIAAFLDLEPKSILFCYYFWMSKTKELRAIDQGAAQPNLNTKIIGEVEINLPTLAEQQEIVRILDELLGNEQRIKEAAEEMLDKIAMMKKSILADAFRGKLGTNDPADEPATELLRQILA